MPTSPLILLTRGSPLALRQAEWVQASLESRVSGLRVELQIVQTRGDRFQDRPLPEVGGKGLFTREMEEALLTGRAHLAVHSLKDLPTELPPGLILGAVPAREDPRDVLVSREGKRWAELPPGTRLGTSSIRRAAQLRRLRPELSIKPLRGNLDTRLRKVREGQVGAAVLAAAGLRRMGLDDQVTEYFSEDVLCPAVGQGALGIEAREEDEATLRLLAALEDPDTRIAVTAERSVLKHLGGGCQVPIAALARREPDRLRLTALVIHPEGTQALRAVESVLLASDDPDRAAAIEVAEALGKRAAENLLKQGAGRILQWTGRELETLPRPEAP